MARILIADEHPMTRYAVRSLLQDERHSIVGEACDGLEALSMTSSLSPDLLIIDLDLSRVTGLDVISRLRARGLHKPILGFSTQDSEHFVSRFLQVGASGFVSKHQGVEVLKEAVAVLLRGQSYFPSEMLGSVHRGSLREKDAERVASLSNRELSVLSLLASGYSNQAIASELTISEKSVSTYRARMRAKLNLHSMLDLIDFARRNRLAAPTKHLQPPAAEENGSVSMWRSMVEGLPAAFYVRDTEARLLYANPAHLAMYRADLEQVQGTLTTEVGWYKPSDAQNMLRFLQRAIAEERSFDKDIELDIHGQRRVLHHWGTPYRDAQGNLLGMICCSTDITQRYEQLEAQRVRAETAELAQRHSADLLESVNQHLGASLAALGETLSTDSAGATKQIQEIQGYLRSLQDALEKTSELRQQQTVVELAELVDDVLLDLRNPANQKQLGLHLDVDGASRHPVLTDRQRLADLLRHLGRYVIDLTPTGEVRFSLVSTLKQKKLGTRITLQSNSNRTSHTPRAYSLAELTADPGEPAQGRNSLDLNIARHLASRLGAELHLNHQADQGVVATLHFLLPVADLS